MATPKQILKDITPKLIFFFITVIIYFAVFIPVSQPSIYAAVLKCLPIISLIGFVIMHGMSLGDEYTYSRRILFGLLFSIVGDFLLIWPETFKYGVVSFFATQLLYVSAFGFYPFNYSLAIVLGSILVIGLSVVWPFLNALQFGGCCLYLSLLMTMVWRGVARVQLFEDILFWPKLFSGIGAILFAISDIFLVINRFGPKLPYSQMLIMTTYYAAQLFISLSIDDSNERCLDKQRAHHKKNI